MSLMQSHSTPKVTGQVSVGCGPIDDLQVGDSAEVAVFCHDRAVAECKGDGRDLNIDLLHQPAGATELGVEQTEHLCCGLVECP